MDIERLKQLDQSHVWHPYSAMGSDRPVYPVASANGVRLKLMDDRELIDGMSSWWSAIHGYNHPTMNQALTDQINNMSHVMFGGLTHQPAVELASRLVDITPEPLQSVFFSDSGSVSVEVAMKMAIQYWHSKG
ncbi:MAG: aminotransferase class III-fold pyridoxal phosphate-dependent enzyme, partial [Gammaproteobacteria bacterium]